MAPRKEGAIFPDSLTSVKSGASKTVISEWVAVLGENRTSIGFTNNSGTRCYRNSALQVILHLPAFLAWIRSTHTSNKCTVPDKAHCMPCRLCELAIRNWDGSTSRPLVAASRAFDEASALASSSSTADDSYLDPWDKEGQQDASEYLQWLLNALRAGLEESHRGYFDVYFETTLLETRTCRKCKHSGTSAAKENIWWINIAERTEGGRLDKHIAKLFAEQRLEGYVCEACRTPDSTEKSTQLVRPPYYLFMALSRFRHDPKHGLEKITDKVRYTDVLDLSAYEVDEQWKPLKYELLGAIHHEHEIEQEKDGKKKQFVSAMSGHYKAVMEGPDGRWRELEDLMVTDSTITQACNPNGSTWTPYILVYRKVLPPQSGGKTTSAASSGTGSVGLFGSGGPRKRKLEVDLTLLDDSDDAPSKKIRKKIATGPQTLPAKDSKEDQNAERRKTTAEGPQMLPVDLISDLRLEEREEIYKVAKELFEGLGYGDGVYRPSRKPSGNSWFAHLNTAERDENTVKEAWKVCLQTARSTMQNRPPKWDVPTLNKFGVENAEAVVQSWKPDSIKPQRHPALPPYQSYSADWRDVKWPFDDEPVPKPPTQAAGAGAGAEKADGKPPVINLEDDSSEASVVMLPRKPRAQGMQNAPAGQLDRLPPPLDNDVNLGSDGPETIRPRRGRGRAPRRWELGQARPRRRERRPSPLDSPPPPTTVSRQYPIPSREYMSKEYTSDEEEDDYPHEHAGRRTRSYKKHSKPPRWARLENIY